LVTEESVASKNRIKSPFAIAVSVTEKVGASSEGDVNVLFVSVSVVAKPTRVSVAAGRVNVTSAVDAGPINVTLLVPLSLSSKNSKNPALVEPFLIVLLHL
jgi:hypothetical protein